MPSLELNAPMVLDYTTLSNFLMCRMKYLWIHIEDLKPKEDSSALFFGHAMHSALASLYRGDGIEKALKVFVKEYSTFAVPDGDKRTMERGLAILTKYYDEKFIHNPFDVIDVEISHVIDIHKGLKYAARMDAVVKRNGKIWVLEEKSTSALGANFFDAFILNHQVDGYVFACLDKYGECSGAIIDAILVAKTKFTFLRDDVTRDADHVETFTAELLDIEKNIRWANANKSYVKNKGACTYYGKCGYRDLCRYKGLKQVRESRYVHSEWDALHGKEIRSDVKEKVAVKKKALITPQD